MLASHYAPGAAVRIGATSVLPGEALLAFGSALAPRTRTKAVAILNLSPSGDLREASGQPLLLPAASRPQRRRDHRRRADPHFRPRRGDQRPALPCGGARAISSGQSMTSIDPALLDRFTEIVGEAHALRAEADISLCARAARAMDRPHAAGAEAGQRRGGEPHPGARHRNAHACRAAGRQHRPRRRPGAACRSGNEIVVSLSRLNRVREIDTLSNTVTAEAGVVLEALHRAVDAADRMFPLSLASQGSCEIGGNLSSNAGGTAVLAYGNTRELCLGVEVVLPTGEVFDDLRKLKKDNTGYDLKNLFVGAEGTLGIITAAVLKIFPKPRGREVGWAGVSSPEAALCAVRAGEASLPAATSPPSS